MRIAIISPKNRTIYNFRGDLIKEMIRLGHSVFVTGPNHIDVEKIESLGATFTCIPLEKNGLNIFDDIKYFFKLRSFLKKNKIDISLGYTIKPVIYGSIAARLANVKHISALVTGAGYLFTANTLKSRLLKIIAKFLYRIGFSCAHHIIFQNPDDRDEFIENSLLKKEKCFVVNGSGVNMNQFKPSTLPSQLTFFMLGRIMISKGVREYLSAAKIIKEKYPNIRFMLLGAIENIQDSLTMSEIQPFIDNDIIEFFGETSNVTAFYAKTSVFVLPSYREGTPRTVLEAMAMKRPIITTNAPGCRQTVLNGKTGFLVPIKDTAALAEKMEWMINHPDQIASMGEAAYQHCKDTYDVIHVNQNMLKIMKVL